MSNTRRTETHADYEDLVAQLAEVREQVRELSKVTKDVAKGRIRAAGEAGSEALGRGREKVEHANDEFVGLVRRRPWTAIAVAAGVGLLFGALSSRR